MIDIPIYNMQGEQTGSFPLDPARLGGTVRHTLLKQAYVRTHANMRRPNAVTKSRGLVEGSTRKLYKQKGTGNARRGDRKANILRGGGHAKAKVSHSWNQDMPAKMRKLANRNAVLAKAIDGEIKLVEALSFDKPSTKQAKTMLDALGVNRTCLFAVSDTTSPAAASARNLDDVTVTVADRLAVYDLLSHRFLVADAEAFKAKLDLMTAGVKAVAESDVTHEEIAAQADETAKEVAAV